MGTMTEKDKTYNGWTNYATWGVALVLDNDRGTYERAHELAEMVQRDAPASRQVKDGIWTAEQYARFELADLLKDYTEELCGLDGGDEDYPEPTLMARQVIAAGLADVNWEEVAEHYFEG